MFGFSINITVDYIERSHRYDIEYESMNERMGELGGDLSGT